MGECGWFFKRIDIPDGTLYFEQMIKDERVMVFYDDKKPIGFLAYSICDDYLPFWRKSAWEFKPHNPEGKIVFIEHMAFKNFDKKFKTLIERSLISKYPDFECAIWRRNRKPEDKKVIVKRRIYEKV